MTQKSRVPDVVVRRVREPREDEKTRILVDRLWPRGVSKSDADLDTWAKAVTPSTELRKEFHSGGMTFKEFDAAYSAELEATDGHAALTELAQSIAGQEGTVALLIAGKTDEPNHADVLRRHLIHHLKG